MQVVNKKMCVIVILVLVIIESCTLFLMYKSFGNKNTNLAEVNLNISNTNMFAIMLEQEDGTYKEDTTNTWPTSGYTYNASMSGCIDINGNKIEDALTYDKENNKASVNTTNTSYCYLYFSIPPYASQKSEMWDSPLEGDGYRYVGENPNNYICFGTTDKTTCTNNMDLYMYRIIGIFEDSDGKEHLKLIKKETLNTSYKWHSDYQTSVDWGDSDLYKGLNGDYFLNNKYYSYMQDTTWTEKIVEWDYIATNTLTDESLGIDYVSNTPKSIYLHELNRSTKTNQTCYRNDSTIADCSVGEWKEVSAKIGLMYVSDYMLSLGSITLDVSTLNTGWMYLYNNDLNPSIPSDYTSALELTMSRSDMTSYADLSIIYGISPYGIAHSMVLYETSVRPVFYLTSDTKLTGGDGSSSNPYILG